MSTATVDPQALILIEITGVTSGIGMSVPELAVVEVITAAMVTQVGVVAPSHFLEIIDNAIRGEPGPTGPPGLQKVVHGSDPNYLRPAVPLVYWVGSVHPLNADPDDLLMLKEA